MLKTDRAFARIEKLLSDMRTLEKEREAAAAKTATKGISTILERSQRINGITVISHRLEDLEQKDLRTLADALRDKVGSGIILLSAAKNSQASMLLTVTKDLSAKFNAGEILKEIAAMAGGRGGGKAEMAQGGTSDLAALDKAMESIYHIIQERSAVGSR